MFRKSLHFFTISALAGAAFAGDVAAQESVKVGLVMPLTGVLGPVGKQAVAGARPSRWIDPARLADSR